MRFVWIEDARGLLGPINPDQVLHLRENISGDTCIVFGAIPGGYHEIPVKGSMLEIATLLETPALALAKLEGTT